MSFLIWILKFFGKVELATALQAYIDKKAERVSVEVEKIQAKAQEIDNVAAQQKAEVDIMPSTALDDELDAVLRRNEAANKQR